MKNGRPTASAAAISRRAETHPFAACTFHFALFTLALGGATAAGAETIFQARARLEQDYAARLADLAHWCDEHGLAEQAETARHWQPPPRALTLVVPLIDVPVETPPAAGREAAKLAEWSERFTKLRQAQGQALFELAVRAAQQRQAAEAYQLVHAVVREDPQHAAARRMLGYHLRDGRWRTAFEASKDQARQVWHERFGWLPATHVDRYEAGQRCQRGRWIDAAADARLHSDIDHGWEIATEHYLVRTNHSLEEGVRLAARLERLYGVWRQIFVRFSWSDAQLARLFKDGEPARPGNSNRHKVVYFRNRQEYIDALIAEQPNIGISTGYYLRSALTAYFFFDDQLDEGHFYHEATHQLFMESREVADDVARDANFWIVEGIACLMESLTRRRGYCTIGGPDAIRLDNARQRFAEGFYVPLAELSMIGMLRLQHDERIAQLYSQASGLTYFLFFADEGRHRQALTDYLVAVYTGRDRSDTLARLTAKSFSTLDAEYRQFIEPAPSAR